jgi:hypothetical protein
MLHKSVQNVLGFKAEYGEQYARKHIGRCKVLTAVLLKIHGIWLCIIGQSKNYLLLVLILWNVSGHSMSTLWEEYISVNQKYVPFSAHAIGYDALS